jgi:ribosomal protein L28
MASKREKLPNLKKVDPLQPIDVTKLGSNGDPCFGKAYDLSTKECKLCGDSELCCLKMSQSLNITRKELEAKNHYKDLDNLEDVNGIKKYIRGLKRKGSTRKEIVEKASIKFEVPKKDIRLIYKSMK